MAAASSCTHGQEQDSAGEERDLAQTHRKTPAQRLSEHDLRPRRVPKTLPGVHRSKPSSPGHQVQQSLPEEADTSWCKEREGSSLYSDTRYLRDLQKWKTRPFCSLIPLVLETVIFIRYLFMIRCTWLIAILNELRNIFKRLSFSSNIVSISRDKLHNQKLLGILSNF